MTISWREIREVHGQATLQPGSGVGRWRGVYIVWLPITWGAGGSINERREASLVIATAPVLVPARGSQHGQSAPRTRRGGDNDLSDPALEISRVAEYQLAAVPNQSGCPACRYAPRWSLPWWSRCRFKGQRRASCHQLWRTRFAGAIFDQGQECVGSSLVAQRCGPTVSQPG